MVLDVDLGTPAERRERLVVEVSEATLWRAGILAGGLLAILAALLLTGGAVLVLGGSVLAGAGFTYLSGLELALEERLAYGTVIGAVLFTAALLLVALTFGMGLGTVLLALLVTFAAGGVGLVSGRGSLRTDLSSFAARLRELWPLWLVLGICWPFTLHLLAQAYTFTPAGLVAGQQAVYGDWAAHLQYAGSFAFAHNFPPEFPVDPGHRLSYPFMVDLFAAGLVPLGTSLTSALVLTSGLLGLAFPAVMYLAAKRFTGSSAASALAVFIFLLSGGLGFVYLAQDFDQYGFNAILTPARDYTFMTDRNLQWLNPVLAYMYPQRSTLFGFSLALILMAVLWTALNTEGSGRRPFLVAGVIAGLTPLFHVHAYGTVVVLGIFWAALSWRGQWLWYFLPALALGIPALAWLITPGAAILHSQPGWLASSGGHNDNAIWFWLKNLGLFIPILLVAQFWPKLVPGRFAQFFAPLWLWFLVPNFFVFQPWDWDNNKFMIFWTLFGSILVGAALVRLAARSREGVALAAILFLVLSAAGGLSLIRASNYALSSALFNDPSGIQTAMWVRTHTEPDAVLLVAPDHNEPVADLSGRRLVVGYPGWLWTYGLTDWASKSQDTQTMLRGGEATPYLVRMYGVSYVVIGPHELSSNVGANTAYWDAAGDRVYVNGPYTVYRVR